MFSQDNYEWNGNELIVYTQELDMINIIVFPPETEDQDCSAYLIPDEPMTFGILTSKVEVMLISDGSFDVWSHMCEMSIWDYQDGDTFRWNGDVLEIERADGDDIVLVEFEPEPPFVDCEAY